jgi:hypothetical protein
LKICINFTFIQKDNVIYGLEKNKLLILKRDQQTKLNIILEQEKKLEDEQKFLVEKAENHAVLAFGRMNPITSGHQKLIDKVKNVANTKPYTMASLMGPKNKLLSPPK